MGAYASTIVLGLGALDLGILPLTLLGQPGLGIISTLMPGYSRSVGMETRTFAWMFVLHGMLRVASAMHPHNHELRMLGVASLVIEAMQFLTERLVFKRTEDKVLVPAVVLLVLAYFFK